MKKSNLCQFTILLVWAAFIWTMGSSCSASKPEQPGTSLAALAPASTASNLAFLPQYREAFDSSPGYKALEILNTSPFVRAQTTKFYGSHFPFPDTANQNAKKLDETSVSISKLLEMNLMKNPANKLRLASELSRFGLMILDIFAHHEIDHDAINLNNIHVQNIDFFSDGLINWDKTYLYLSGFENARTRHRDSGIRKVNEPFKNTSFDQHKKDLLASIRTVLQSHQDYIACSALFSFFSDELLLPGTDHSTFLAQEAFPQLDRFFQNLMLEYSPQSEQQYPHLKDCIPLSKILDLKIMDYYPNRIQMAAQLSAFSLRMLNQFKRKPRGELDLSNIYIKHFDFDEFGLIDWRKTRFVIGVPDVDHPAIPSSKSTISLMRHFKLQALKKFLKTLLLEEYEGIDSPYHTTYHNILDRHFKHNSKIPVRESEIAITDITLNHLDTLYGDNLENALTDTPRENDPSILGSGSSGRVLKLNYFGPKALKIQHPNLSPELFRHFQQESEFLEMLNHEKYFPKIYKKGISPKNEHYFVMDLLENQTLEKTLESATANLNQKGRLQLAKIIAIAGVQAIESLRQKGIVHRDIKPENILLKNLFIKNGEIQNPEKTELFFIDFSVAIKTSDARENFKPNGNMFGTLDYMDPKILQEPASHVHDLYSLSVVLSRILSPVAGGLIRNTGELTIPGAFLFKYDLTDPDTFRKHLNHNQIPDSDEMVNFFHQTMSSDHPRITEPYSYLATFLGALNSLNPHTENTVFNYEESISRHNRGRQETSLYGTPNSLFNEVAPPKYAENKRIGIISRLSRYISGFKARYFEKAA